MRTFEGKAARRRSGFTLIEMLVVVVIMVVLMGLVFRLTRGAMAKSDYAKEEKIVTLVRTLIEDFHAEYNIYPPVPSYRTHDGETRQPINFRGVCPDGARSRAELNYYPGHWSYAKVEKSNGQWEDCYFIFGLFSFFVDRSKFGETAIEVGRGEQKVLNQWDAYNDSIGGIGGKITISQKDKAFAHRVWPIVAEVCGNDGTFEEPKLFQTYDRDTGYSLGYTTHVYGQWAWGIGEFDRDGTIDRVYDEGLVYISKPPFTTYLLFSKGPDRDYDHDYPEDRTRPKNKDNIYGNLGDK